MLTSEDEIKLRLFESIIANVKLLTVHDTQRVVNAVQEAYEELFAED